MLHRFLPLYDVYVKDDLLNEALNNLPAKKREIILLSYFLDMSHEEIGAMVGVVLLDLLANVITAGFPHSDKRYLLIFYCNSEMNMIYYN